MDIGLKISLMYLNNIADKAKGHLLSLIYLHGAFGHYAMNSEYVIKKK